MLALILSEMAALDQVSAVVLAKVVSIFGGICGSLATSALLVAVLMGCEVALIGWPRSSLRRLMAGTPSALLDIVSTLLVLTNLALLAGTFLSFGLIYLIAHSLKSRFALNYLDFVGHPLLSYGLYILALDLANYWTHRLMHQSPSLWQIHRFHHSATEMTMLNALRDHPLERALSHGVGAIPTALLGIPPFHYVGAQLAMQALGYLKHSNLSSHWGVLGLCLFQSPAAHRLHHSTDPRYHNCNYSSIFQFFDVMFGTAKQPRRGQKILIGVDGEPCPSNPIAALWRTTIMFYETFFFRR